MPRASWWRLRTCVLACVFLWLLQLGGADVSARMRDPMPAPGEGARSAIPPDRTPTGTACPGDPSSPDGPDPWGACWPGPATTGVPSGTTLDSSVGDRTVSTRGAVVDGWDVDGCIVVSALGVTIQNSRARCITLESDSPARYCRPSESAVVRDLTDCTFVPGVSDVPEQARQQRLVIRDSEIDCEGRPGDGGTATGDRNMLVLRVDIHGCENGFDADSFVTVRHSYVHDLFNSVAGDPHTDGLQSAVGARLRVVHNVFFAFTTGCDYPGTQACNGTAAINIGGQSGMSTVRDTLVRRNMLAGGAATLYCPTRPPDGFAIIENRFSEVYSPHVGEYMAMSHCGGPGITKRGNKRLHY
jgi:hypothetical protein